MKKNLLLAFLAFTFVCKSQFQVTQAFNGGGKCVDVQDGSMSFTVTGVNPPFNCIITNTSGCVLPTPSLTTTQSAFTFTGFPGCMSLYQLNVYSTSNVLLGTQYVAFGVYSSTPLSINTFSMMAANCATCCNGSVYLSATGGSFQNGPGYYTIDNVYLGAGFFPASGICPGTHTVCVKDNVGCTKCTTITIPVSNVTGIIDHNEFSSVKISPNPFVTDLTISTNNDVLIGEKITITNMVGKEVYKKEIEYNEEKLRLQFLDPGVYFLYYHSKQNIIYKSKIIKL